LLLFAISMLVGDLYVLQDARWREIAAMQRALETEVRILSADPVAWARISPLDFGDRVESIDSAGKVLAGINRGQSVAGDQEVQDALAGRTTSLIRRVGDSEFCFAASPVARGDFGSAVRVSRSLEPGTAAVSRLRNRLLALTLVSALLALCMTYVFMRSFAKRIERLRIYVEGLPDASLPDDALPAGNDELGTLAQSLRRSAPKIRDLLDRLKLESARREAILASMVEGVLAVDSDLRVTFCNASFARTMGARMPVREGMPLLDLARDPGLRDILVTVLQTGNSVERRLQLRAAQSHSFEVQAAPLAVTSARGAIAILHDITELERLERVRKDFVANVSHELRTPLAAIRGYAETLLDGALDDQEHNRKFVEIILAHSIRLNNIASDLLILSELESGAATQPKRVSVRATIEAALRTVESAAKVRGVRLVCGRVDDFQVLGYEIRLEQTFVNLLDNAVKFNRPQGEVRIEAAGTENGFVSITVSDTGIGIPSGDLPRIFERFYRVDKARSRQVGGTGLGLSIVRHVVEQMGGSIRVESELGKGSKFIVLLPCAEATATFPL
jgi:two-component system phosphate regulon sensor histidine kinase PhoR